MRFSWPPVGEVVLLVSGFLTGEYKFAFLRTPHSVLRASLFVLQAPTFNPANINSPLSVLPKCLAGLEGLPNKLRQADVIGAGEYKFASVCSSNLIGWI